MPVSYTHLVSGNVISPYPLKTFLISQRKGKGLSGRCKGAFLMDKHPRCGAVLQLADKEQTADLSLIHIFYCDLWPYDRDLPCHIRCADSDGHHDGQGMGRHGPELPAQPAGPGLPGVFDYRRCV